MLRYVQFTTPSQTKTDPNQSRRRWQAWATIVVACVALGLFSSSAIGQDTEIEDPPAATAESAQKESGVEQTEGETKTPETKTPEVPVALKTLAVDLQVKELSFEAPENWKAKKPRFNFTKHELMLPKAEGDKKDARMTFTISSGSTESNIDRWKSQFKFPLGAAPDKVFSVEKKKMKGYDMSLIQIRGTFLESTGGPMSGGKKTPRKDYMMKAVIISPEGADARTPKLFIKLVGSEKTLKQHAKAYTAMVKSMKTQAAVD